MSEQPVTLAGAIKAWHLVAALAPLIGVGYLDHDMIRHNTQRVEALEVETRDHATRSAVEVERFRVVEVQVQESARAMAELKTSMTAVSLTLDRVCVALRPRCRAEQ